MALVSMEADVLQLGAETGGLLSSSGIMRWNNLYVNNRISLGPTYVHVLGSNSNRVCCDRDTLTTDFY